MNRRSFLASCVAAPTLGLTRELAYDVAIIGAGVGGCAAALAAARSGASVLLSEETDWIGGQLTAQAVPPDEHPWIESFGATRLYREYRASVRAYYRRYYPLTEAARSNVSFNPGNGTVSRLTHEPRVSLAVLENMLAPHLSSGRITLLLRHRPLEAGTSGATVQTVILESLESGHRRAIHASYFLDATETGELLPLTKTEYVTGFETRAQPQNMQAFTCCFAMDYLPGEDHTIDRPDEYAFWRDYVPNLSPPYTGKLLSMDMPEPATLRKRALDFEPGVTTCRNGKPSFWAYRRILDPANFTPGAYRSGITLVNWPQNDYLLGNLFEVSEAEAAKNLKRAKQQSLSFLYWLQTEHPRPDGGEGWRGLRLRPDVVGTEDGLAKYPYIRESRRIVAEFTVRAEHVGTDARAQATGQSREEVTAAVFDDSVGVGSYRIDLHPSSGGDNYIDVSSLPFQIPLGALLPRRIDNLLPACKNLGVDHIANGCYRLHPVEWNIGESAGYLAAFALEKKVTPRAVRHSKILLAEFQNRIRAAGVETAWPKLTPR